MSSDILDWFSEPETGGWSRDSVESPMDQKYIYWSSLETYWNCPRKFLWGYGWGDIDLGRGPGRSKEKPVRDSRHDAVMGLVIGYAVERLYNDELWREPAKLSSAIEEIVRREFTLAISENYIDWYKAPPKEEMLKVCLEGARGYLQTMKTNKLLGPYARSEVDITAWIDKYTPIGGRPDVIIRRDDTGITIIDGKNAKTPGKYTDPNQLKWYALCFYLFYGELPNQLAFCYFRYPEGKPPADHDPATPWTGLVSVPFVKDDLKILATKAKESYRDMGKGHFDPTPSPSVCKHCSYESVCDARIAQKAANTRGGVKAPKEDLSGGSPGIVELSLVSEDSLTKKRRAKV